MERNGNHIRKSYKILLIVFNMKTTYTETEFNKMKNFYEKKVQSLDTKLAKVTTELKEVKEDYEVLLATAAEVVPED